MDTPRELIAECERIVASPDPPSREDLAVLHTRLSSYLDQPAHWGARQLAEIGICLLKWINHEETPAGRWS